MADVPEVDYQGEFAKLVQADDHKAMPAPIRAIFDNKDLRHYLFGNRSYSTNERITLNNGTSHYVYLRSVAVTNAYEPSSSVKPKFTAIMQKLGQQDQDRVTLSRHIEAAIGGCRTLKQAHERLPEFAKYLPAAEVKTPMLPAIANLAAELVKAGWPKGKEPVAA